MKQKIKNSCFSKMKQVALALFAALCVGNVWGQDKDRQFFFPEPSIRISSTGLITIGGDTQVLPYQSISGLKCSVILSYSIDQGANPPITYTEEIDSFACATGSNDGKPKWYYYGQDGYTYQIPNFDQYLGSDVTISFKHQLNKSVKAAVGWGKINANNLPYLDSHTTTVTLKTVGVMSTKAEWTNDSKKFTISGQVIGDDGAKIRIRYKLIKVGDPTPEFEDLITTTDVLAQNRAYSLVVDYEDFDAAIVWTVSTVTGSGEDEVEEYYENQEIFRRNRLDDQRVTYTWKGGSGDWTDITKWEHDTESAIGYPGTDVGGTSYTSVRFESDAEVFFKSGNYMLRDGGTSLYFAPGINVVLKDGTLGLHSSYVIGAAGTTVEYNNMKLIYTKSSPDSHTNLSFADGSTNIFAGTINCPLNYLPVKSNTKVVFKDGEIKTEYSNSGFSNLDSHEVEINNAAWLIKVNNSTTGATRGIAGVVKFRDGVDRQAQLKVQSNKALMLQGTYDFVLSSDREYTHYVEAGNAFVAETKDNAGNVTDHTTYKCNIKVDATALVGEATVPLMKFTAVNNYTEETMAEMVDPANNYLKVIVDGKEVDNSKYGASLLWKNNILYYQQVEPKVAAITKTETDDAGNETEVTTAEYSTLGEALEAATDGATIKVLNDVEITSYLQITKSLTLNLNGKSITRTDSTDNSTALFVNAADAIVTITGDGTVTADHAVYVNAGKVVIENGTFSAGTHAVYVINNGNAEIKGGTFSSEVGQYHYALNEYDQTRDATSIVVTGGTFVGFNPANNTAEGDNTNFCADGYTAVPGEEEGTWVVQKAISELKPGVPVTNISATTEEEAISKVKLTVEVPAGANITKDDYAKYFKLVATETSEGSGVWEVAAVLDDTKVTPVIAATTDENGVVTPAITFEDGKVTVNIENELPGLYYGVRYATTVDAVDAAEIVPHLTVTPAAGDTAGFFKVVVDFKPITATEVE